jgi:hypothetical protein
MLVYVTMFRSLKRTVRSCAPFVPLYCEKLHVVGLSQDDVFLAEKQWDAVLRQYFHGCSRIIARGPSGPCVWSEHIPVQI